MTNTIRTITEEQNSKIMNLQQENNKIKNKIDEMQSNYKLKIQDLENNYKNNISSIIADSECSKDENKKSFQIAINQNQKNANKVIELENEISIIKNLLNKQSIEENNRLKHIELIEYEQNNIKSTNSKIEKKIDLNENNLTKKLENFLSLEIKDIYKQFENHNIIFNKLQQEKSQMGVVYDKIETIEAQIEILNEKNGDSHRLKTKIIKSEENNNKKSEKSIMILERDLNSQKILIQNIDKNIDKIITEIKTLDYKYSRLEDLSDQHFINKKSMDALNKKLDLMEKNDSKTKDEHKIDNIIAETLKELMLHQEKEIKELESKINTINTDSKNLLISEIELLKLQIKSNTQDLSDNQFKLQNSFEIQNNRLDELKQKDSEYKNLFSETKTTEMLADNINKTKNEINIDIMKLNNQYNNYNEILLKLNHYDKALESNNNRFDELQIVSENLNQQLKVEIRKNSDQVNKLDSYFKIMINVQKNKSRQQKNY